MRLNRAGLRGCRAIRRFCVLPPAALRAAGPEAMQAPNLAAEPHVGHHLGRDYANRAERRDTKDMPSNDGVVGRVEVDWDLIRPIASRATCDAPGGYVSGH